MGVKRTRILLVDMPRILRDLVSDVVTSQPDLEVVGDLAGDADLFSEVARARPDFVVVAATHGELPVAMRPLFEVHPRLKVLALQSEGKHGQLWELAPRRVPLGEMSPTALVAAIRDAKPWVWDTCHGRERGYESVASPDSCAMQKKRGAEDQD